MDAQADQEEKAPRGIPLREYTREVKVLADLVTETRSLKAILISALSQRESNPVPYDGPITGLVKERAKKKLQKHQSLVARVLPHKRKG